MLKKAASFLGMFFGIVSLGFGLMAICGVALGELGMNAFFFYPIGVMLGVLVVKLVRFKGSLLFGMAGSILPSAMMIALTESLGLRVFQPVVTGVLWFFLPPFLGTLGYFLKSPGDEITDLIHRLRRRRWSDVVLILLAAAGIAALIYYIWLLL